jgi:hypothetical protein
METDLGHEQYADEKDLTEENRLDFEKRKKNNQLTIAEWLRLPTRGY